MARIVQMHSGNWMTDLILKLKSLERTKRTKKFMMKPKVKSLMLQSLEQTMVHK
jgi:hypothetical protein